MMEGMEPHASNALNQPEISYRCTSGPWRLEIACMNHVVGEQHYNQQVSTLSVVNLK